MFTEGPWKFEPPYIVSADPTFGRRSGRVAKVSIAYKDTATFDANARLISAAPELLEALGELHTMVWGECPSLLNEDSGGTARLDSEIRAALAKARGE